MGIEQGRGTRSWKATLAYLALIAVTSGCVTTAKFVYPSNLQGLKEIYPEPKYHASLAVLPFEDARPDKNNAGGYFIYLIPLVPYGTATYERPDAARFFNTISEYQFNVPEDAAKAAVTSLKRSNLFKNVFFRMAGMQRRPTSC